MSSGINFIPAPHGEFDDWQDNFVLQVNAFKAGWNWNSDAVAEWALLTTAIGPPINKQARWVAAWAKVKSKIFTHADELEMLAARKTYESGDKENPADTSLRLFIARYIAKSVKVTTIQKAAMRLTDGTTTTHTPAPLPGAKLIPTHLALKKQIHLSIQIEVIYAGTISKAKQKGVKNVCLYMLVQAANLTTIPDPNNTNYAHIGNMKRGTFIQPFTLAQENEAALFTMREESTKGVFGKYIGVFRIVIS